MLRAEAKHCSDLFSHDRKMARKAANIVVHPFGLKGVL
jgi:hypothetical protein